MYGIIFLYRSSKETFFIQFHEKEFMKNYFICILIVSVICCGCLQKNTITGIYLNEADNDQYISLGEMGTYSHYNYDNRPGFFRMGNYTVNNTLLRLSYSDGEISEFSLDGNELVPINENKSAPTNKMYEKRFAKRLKQ